MAYKTQCNNAPTGPRQLDPRYRPPLALAAVQPLPDINPDDPSVNPMYPFHPPDPRLILLERRRPGGHGPTGQFTQEHNDHTADVYLLEDTPNGPNSMLVAFNVPLTLVARGNTAPIFLSTDTSCVSSVTYVIKYVLCVCVPSGGTGLSLGRVACRH
jgi:hypothetical protein